MNQERFSGVVCDGPHCGPTNQQLKEQLPGRMNAVGLPCAIGARGRCFGECEDETSNVMVLQGLNIVAVYKHAAVTLEDGSVMSFPQEIAIGIRRMADDPSLIPQPTLVEPKL